MSDIEKWLKEVQKDRQTIEHIIKEKKQMLKDLDSRVIMLKKMANEEELKKNK